MLSSSRCCETEDLWILLLKGNQLLCEHTHWVIDAWHVFISSFLWFGVWTKPSQTHPAQIPSPETPPSPEYFESWIPRVLNTLYKYIYIWPMCKRRRYSINHILFGVEWICWHFRGRIHVFLLCSGWIISHSCCELARGQTGDPFGAHPTSSQSPVTLSRIIVQKNGWMWILYLH